MTNRHQVLAATFIFCFLLISARLFYWQILKSPQLKKQAISQTQNLKEITPQRGKILSSDNFPLALNQISYQLSLYKPNLKQNLETVISQIENIKPGFISQNKSLLADFQNNPQQLWIDFATPFSQKEADILQSPGISFQQSYHRFYPEDPLASSLIGLLAKNTQGNSTGYGGLEGYYNRQLQGKTGFIKTAQDATGQTILSQKIWQSQAQNGLNLHTHIHRSIQFLVEEKLKQAVSRYQAQSGSIIVTTPQNGAVIAMASFTALSASPEASQATPSANPNTAISHLFEPGSIFKPLVLAIALDSQSIKPDYICNQCHHPRTLAGYTINNWDNQTHPNSNIKDIIKNSDNIGMSYIGTQIEAHKFQKYFRQLGMTQKTGIDLQGEAKPLVKNSWSQLDLATASFGQGFAINQIQMIHAFNTLANPGWHIPPRVVNYVSLNHQTIKTNQPQKQQVFSSQTTQQLKNILEYAVTNSNLAKLKPPQLQVCAKSGTAQIAQGGQYTQSETIASFIGFTPCYQPKFSMIVTLNRPQTSPWGSTTAAPVWFDLAPRILALL